MAEHTIDGVPVQFFVQDESDVIQQWHVLGRWFEERELRVIRENYGGGTFVDVGANVGNHALFALLALRAPKLIAFEPNPAALKICRLNFLLNRVEDRAEVRPIGLSDQPGRAKIIHRQENNLGATRLMPGGGDLTLIRGDDALRDEEDVSFIKIDVEAFEIRVLEGLRRTISRCRPTLLVEVDDQNVSQFRDFVDSVGYEHRGHFPSAGNSNYLIRPPHYGLATHVPGVPATEHLQ